MNKINWKLRLQNKVTLTSLAVILITISYKFLDMIGVIPSIPQTEIVTFVELIILALATLGIVVDPTTAGVADSKQAQTYEEPKKETEV